MNGGRLIRVTSRPLSAPAPVASRTPMARARMPGMPSSWARVAMTIIDSTMIAPTERSMPAVRMTRVWPTARAATTAVCWSRMPIEFAVRNVGVAMKNATNATSEQEQRAEPRLAVELVLHPLDRGLPPPSELGGSRRDRRWRSWVSCPSRSSCPRRCDAVDAVGLLVGHQGDAGVEEVESLGGLRLLTTAGDLGDGLHAQGRHLQRVLLGGGADDAALDAARRRRSHRRRRR